jgi:hypothetical protein
MPQTPWLSLTRSMMLLGVESQAVIALRIARLSSGDSRAAREAVHMVQEKVVALGQSQLQVTSDVLSGRGHQAAGRAIGRYRRVVRANQRRLSRA